jgi:hypothetical protein
MTNVRPRGLASRAPMPTSPGVSRLRDLRVRTGDHASPRPVAPRRIVCHSRLRNLPLRLQTDPANPVRRIARRNPPRIVHRAVRHVAKTRRATLATLRRSRVETRCPHVPIPRIATRVAIAAKWPSARMATRPREPIAHPMGNPPGHPSAPHRLRLGNARIDPR